ncbi:DUF1835 domain-containing protein [Nibricoccus aquaticus]|nr:DUF1835 domain-containing protein [Nibricoccus aquaticus]
MLHITNGDSAAGSLRNSGVPGQVIAWQDVLHEGPVPAGLMLEEMSGVRARFLAQWDDRSFPEVSASFRERDNALRSACHRVLWFEHDLYDQLQLLQILATLSQAPGITAEMICIDAFPGIVPFYGLGQLTPVQLASLWPKRQPITAEQLSLGARAWNALTSPDSDALRQLLATDLDALPFLGNALRRLLEEYPTPPTGLGRTERQLLRAIARGIRGFADLFRANAAAEETSFMGDTTVKSRLKALMHAPTPLVTPEPYTLTAAGQRVLAGEADARQLNGMDRWIGGVHFKA